MEADTLIMLPGWEKSNGAQAEHRIAVALQSEGVEVEYLAQVDADIILMAHATEQDRGAKDAVAAE
jgi:hypothetical protein